MENTERNSRKKESALLNILPFGIGAGLATAFEYNLYSLLEKSGFYEKFNPDRVIQQGWTAEDIYAQMNLFTVSALGGIALFIGGTLLSDYIIDKVRDRKKITKEKQVL